MNNELNPEFNALLQRVSTEWGVLTQSDNLESVGDSIMNVDALRDQIYDWIFDTLDDEDRAIYLNEYNDFEAGLVESIGGIPSFDVEFNVLDSFDMYEGYYQRYGCMTPDYVLSWDSQNVLWLDDDGNIDTIKRPDVLMASSSNDD